MSKNIKQVFDANPITSNASTDLMYFGQSPYGISDDAAMTFANFSSQFLPSVVVSWDGSTDAVDVTAGSGIDITDGVISLTGTGASAGYGYFSRQPSSSGISFTTIVRYFIPNVLQNLLVSETNNFTSYTDNPFGTGHGGIQYNGTEAAVVQIDMTCVFQYTSGNTNPSTNAYVLSANLNQTSDGNGGFLPIYPITVSGGFNSAADIPFVITSGRQTDPIVMSFQYQMQPGDIIFPAVRNNGTTVSANNNLVMNYFLMSVQKVGDVGGASSGVTSLNGLTANIDLISNDGSVSITTSGADLSFSVGQYITVSSTSQSMSANQSYLCTNVSLTSLSLPTTGCPAGSFIDIAGSGNGLFSITQSAGQVIVDGTNSTTVGASGHLDVTAGNPYSAVKLLCVTDNLSFMVVNSQGNFTPL